MRMQYDFDLMAELTGNTNGTLKKMWPPVKKKAIEAYPSFAAFIGNTGAKITAATGEAKPATLATGRKRKVADAEVDPDTDSKDVERKKKAVPAKKGRAVKKSKAEVKDEEDSADGGDGLGQYTFTQKIVDWLNSADGRLDPKEIEDEV
jgi:hypothetical protein